MNYGRTFNFSAGPAMMPEPVLEEIRDEMMNYRGSGMCVMEMSHRSKVFEQIIQDAEADLRKLMNIPDNYKVLFIQGGGTLQFAMVPMNLMKNGKAVYIETGSWSKKAIAEAKKYGQVIIAASSKDKNFSYIPKVDPANFPKDARFLHSTGNNTVFGTAFWQLPQIPAEAKANGCRLVGDWSSAILGMDIDVKAHDLIYAGAQKNIGPAGVTVVILKKEILEQEIDPVLPIMLRYKPAADARSMYNTPPCFAI